MGYATCEISYQTHVMRFVFFIISFLFSIILSEPDIKLQSRYAAAIIKELQIEWLFVSEWLCHQINIE